MTRFQLNCACSFFLLKPGLHFLLFYFTIMQFLHSESQHSKLSSHIWFAILIINGFQVTASGKYTNTVKMLIFKTPNFGMKTKIYLL